MFHALCQALNFVSAGYINCAALLYRPVYGRRIAQCTVQHFHNERVGMQAHVASVLQSARFDMLGTLLVVEQLFALTQNMLVLLKNLAH